MPLPMSYFPYKKPRPFQDEIISRIFQSEKLVCDVPTGVGKSVSALCGFLADRDEREKIIVLTRTKTQAKIFLKEMARISRHTKRPFMTIPLRSKQESCPAFKNDEVGYEEFLQLCKLNANCIDRIRFNENRDKIDAAAGGIALCNLTSYKSLIGKVAHLGCPYLVLQRLLNHSDVIIASYLYLLHPFLRGMFLSRIGRDMDELLIIIDEAHNLQSVDMLGRTLGRRTVDLASGEINYDFSNVYAMFEGDDSELKIFDLIEKKEVAFLYDRGIEVLERRLKRGKKISYTYRVASFLDTALRFRKEKNWIFFRQEGKLLLKPVFPSDVISPLKDAKKLLLMSGTLSPPEGYLALYGLNGPDGETGCETFSLPNIFPRENCRYFGIKSGLNTGINSRKKYKEKLWMEYAVEIGKIHKSSHETTLVFFPSYGIMRNVGSHVDALKEPPSSSRTDAFWDELRKHSKKIVFAVSGGKLSEGVEYTIENNGVKESVIGTVVIAGFPFPVPDFEMELKGRMYDEKFGFGKSFLLLSVLPMVTKVLQCVGRAIRSETDRAAVVFLDDRIDYFRYFPEEVRHELEFLDLEDVPLEVERFLKP